jgi:alkylation response protein AidB-like acyl-CoA dehydrogenase
MARDDRAHWGCISGCGACCRLDPSLRQEAIEALSPEQQEKYLPKMATGEWSGTMNLTEPQCGTDRGMVRTKATPNGDGSYGISGQKIYITWGDHDMTENVVHLVLARLPDAPPRPRAILARHRG